MKAMAKKMCYKKGTKKVSTQKYEFGTQKMMVPPKADLSTVASPISTGAKLGSTLGPLGTIAGGIAGFGVGVGKAMDMNYQNKIAKDFNNALDYRNSTFSRTEDPKLQQGQEFADGTSGIHIKPENKGKFNATKKATGKTTEELTHSSNPVTKKRAIFAQNAAKWDHSKAESGMNVKNGKVIEVEKKELIFSKDPSGKFLLKEDHLNSPTHENGGKKTVGVEGDIIFPAEMREEALEAYHNGDEEKLEKMRQTLPTDKKQSFGDGGEVQSGGEQPATTPAPKKAKNNVLFYNRDDGDNTGLVVYQKGKWSHNPSFDGGEYSEITDPNKIKYFENKFKGKFTPYVAPAPATPAVDTTTKPIKPKYEPKKPISQISYERYLERKKQEAAQTASVPEFASGTKSIKAEDRAEVKDLPEPLKSTILKGSTAKFKNGTSFLDIKTDQINPAAVVYTDATDLTHVKPNKNAFNYPAQPAIGYKPSQEVPDAIGYVNRLVSDEKKEKSTMKYKKGTKGIETPKYPGGVKDLKLSSWEIQNLRQYKDNPELYKKALWEMIGYTPMKGGPAGSEAWRNAQNAEQIAINNFNKGYSDTRQVGTPNTYNILSQANKNANINPNMGTNVKLNNYVDTGNANAEKLVSEENTGMYKKGSKGLKLPKYAGGVNELNESDDSLNPLFGKVGLPTSEYGNQSALNTVATANPAMEAGNGGGSGFGSKFNLGGLSNGLNTLTDLAPTIYNTAKGLSKPYKTQRNYYTPEQYQKIDRYAPERRAANESYRMENQNIKNNAGGSLGLYLSNQAQSANNRFNRLQDINSKLVSDYRATDNANVDLRNQAKMTNLNLNNQYNEMDLQNIGARNNMLAKGMTGLSDYAQQRRWDKGMANRDQSLLGVIGTGDYTPVQDTNGRWSIKRK